MRDCVFHLLIEGRGQPQYWLHVEAAATATLLDLDRFLRDIWVECCGHLSAFTIGQTSFSVSPDEEFDDESMDVALGQVLGPGLKFRYEYDFGSTTELILNVLSVREGVVGDEAVQLLAENDPPLITCQCGKPAVRVCAQCMWEGAGWLCRDCADKHACGEEMLLPVVNSPRVGMCAYTGRPC